MSILDDPMVFLPQSSIRRLMDTAAEVGRAEAIMAVESLLCDQCRTQGFVTEGPLPHFGERFLFAAITAIRAGKR